MGAEMILVLMTQGLCPGFNLFGPGGAAVWPGLGLC